MRAVLGRQATTTHSRHRPYWAYARAGFRRWSTYRLATFAGAFTNAVFGLVKAALMVATVTAAGGTLAGYDAAAAATYAWVSQALLAPVAVFASDELGQRIRTGDVAVDLARPVDLQLAAWAGDLGRATYQLLPRSIPILLVGAVVTGLVLPPHPSSYLLGLVSLGLGVSVSFGCVWLVNLSAFWLLDVRGPVVLYTVVATVLTGLALPIHWFPEWLRLLATSTPFPSMVQTPADVLTGRIAGADALAALGIQTAWLLVVMVAGHLVLRVATRRLVVQGG